MTVADYDAIVLGAGAAGLMCAAVAGQRGRRVLLLDQADAVGKKILISGGGRCNFTNIYTGPGRYLSANPHFAKSALARYTPADFIALVDRHGIARLLEPAANGGLGDGFAECRNADFSHVLPFLRFRRRGPSTRSKKLCGRRVARRLFKSS